MRCRWRKCGKKRRPAPANPTLADDETVGEDGPPGFVKVRKIVGMKRWAILAVMVMCAGAGAGQDWHSMTFRADAPGVDENPLRGFVPYSMTKEVEGTFPHSLEWFYLPLSDVVTGPDTYDWMALEKELTAISGRGHQAVFRFYVDYPKKPSGIPVYLLNAGLKTFAYEDSSNAKSATPSVSPDYRDPRLIDCMVKFIHAFGAKYDGDVRIAYITVGLYGFWGEWHVHKHPEAGEPAGWAIAQKDKDAILQAYVESFHRTLLIVRTPKVTENRALLANFGYEDDSLLQDTIGKEPWQFWVMMQQVGTTGMWQKRPMGGEIYPALQVGLWDARPNKAGQDMTQVIATTHATWMLASDLFKTVPTAEERANALRAERMLGYTFFCKQFAVKREGAGATVTVRVENRGGAPIYYAWPVEADAVDSTGKTVGKGRALWALPALMPGRSGDWSVTVDGLPEDASAVLLRIANPMPGGHPVAFANAEMGTVREGWLTLRVGEARIP